MLFKLVSQAVVEKKKKCRDYKPNGNLLLLMVWPYCET